LLGYVRLNGEFTYFVILIILLLSAFTLQAFTSDKDFREVLKRSSRLALLVFLSILIMAMLLILLQRSSIMYHEISFDNFKTFIKSLLDNVSFADLLFFSALIQFLTTASLARRYSHQKAFFALSSNMVIMTWLALPFTGLGMESKKELSEKMTTVPRGLHAQELKPLSQTKFLDSSLENELWLLGSYSKKIGYPTEERYPVQLNSVRKFFDDTTLHHFINQQAFVFLCEDTTLNSPTNHDSEFIKIAEFGPGHLKVTISNSHYHYFVLLQNDYPYWQVWVNGKKQSHFTTYKTFIGLVLAQGNQEILLKFDPTPIKNALGINFIIVALGLIVLAIPRLRDIQLTKHQVQ